MDINSIIASEINKNATVNTFTKGMNTDVADNMMPSDQYRLAKNLRVITSDGSNGELRLIEGGKDITQFGDTILATTQIRDYGLLITENSSHEWSIWRYDPNAVTVADRYIKLFGSCADQLGSSISLVTRYEDNDNIKLYIADGLNPLMMINVVNPPLRNGNVSDDIIDISSYSQHAFGGFDNITTIDGNLKSSAVQYAYVLYNKYGKSSNLSPLSPLKIVTCNISKGSGTQTGVEQNVSGTVGFQFDILETNQSGYKKIKVFRINYQMIGQDPTVDMIIDDDLKSQNYNVIDRGSNLINYSYSEFLSLVKTLIIPKEIESKNNYLFASNIKYQIDKSSTIMQKFANLDMSCQIQDADYLNMQSQFNSSWEYSNASFSSFTLHRTTDDIKSLRRDEIYRYGIVFYDKYENPWPVKFLCDLRTPPIYGKTVAAGNLDKGDYVNGDLTKLYVAFTINLENFDNDLLDYFKAYEIVRCKRDVTDRFTITQGIIGRVLECRKYTTTSVELDEYGHADGTHAGLPLCSSGFMSSDRIIVHPCFFETGDGNDDDVVVDRTFAISSENTMLLASPEICYQQDDILNIINQYKNNLSIQAVWQDLNGLKQSGLRVLGSNPAGLHEAQVMYNIDHDNKITGLTFSTYKVYCNDDGYQQPEINKAAWIGTRYYHILHEPLGYNCYKGNSTKQYYALVNNGLTTSIYAFDQTPPAEYFRSPNNVEMRKTIYNNIQAELNAQSRFSNFSKLRSNSKPIAEIKVVNIPTYDQFSQDKTFTFKNNTTSIGSESFIPWSVPTIVNLTSADEIFNVKANFNGEHDGYESSLYYPVSSVGKSLILKTSSSWFNDNSIDDVNLAITVCNLRKLNVTPYGGFTDTARQNSIYYSFGDYHKMDTNATTVFVKSGDCFVQKFRYNAAKTFYSPEYRYAPNMTTVYEVPIESDIDIDRELGWSSKYGTIDENSYIQDKPASLRGYVQTEPCYVANTAYNINQTARYFTGQDQDSLQDIDFDYRICYSDQKSNNESIDSWLNFKSANYIDVDTRYGQITNLRLFKDTLLFWQEQATGVLSVNERTMIQDANDTNIILGNGQVLQRYDYLTTQYGMKPGQFADGQSNTTLYWWDGFKKEILSYAGGQAATPMNKVKTIDNYIKNHYECSHPIIVHDAKYNEVLFNVVGNYPLAYSEVTQQFMSIYDEDIQHKIYFNDKTFVVTSESVLRKWNEYDGDYLNPYLKFVINPQSLYNNTFDLMQIGGNLYKSSDRSKIDDNLLISFTTPLDQEGRVVQDKEGRLPITDREYDYRFAIPRAGRYTGTPPRWVTADWGDRLRGKTMECELASNSDDRDFSLQYIITKYRKSWI